MKHNWIRCSISLIVVLLLALLVSTSVRAISTTVVIGEVQTRGSAGASDEFIEIYNLSTAPVALDNFRIRYQSCIGTGLITLHTIPAGRTLQPYGHYLITGSSYNGTTSGDGIFAASIADCGQLQLQDGLGAAIDTLVYSWAGGTIPTNGWVGVEGTYFGSNPHDNTTATNQDTSMARQPDTLSAVGGHKNGVDTDINASDFLATAASSPENTSSPLAITLRTLSASNNASDLAVPIAVALVSVVVVLVIRRRSRTA